MDADVLKWINKEIIKVLDKYFIKDISQLISQYCLCEPLLPELSLTGTIRTRSLLEEITTIIQYDNYAENYHISFTFIAGKMEMHIENDKGAYYVICLRCLADLTHFQVRHECKINVREAQIFYKEKMYLSICGDIITITSLIIGVPVLVIPSNEDVRKELFRLSKENINIYIRRPELFSIF